MSITSVTLRKEGSLTKKKSVKSIGLCFIVLKKEENGSRLNDKVHALIYFQADRSREGKRMTLSDKISKHERSHDKIVREILPSFAEKLKKEAVISAYDRHPFKIPLVEGWPPIKIIPDLVVHLPNGEKVLVEIANPRDPKRFLGEIVYPNLLRYHKKITKAIIFVLHDLEHQKIHDRGFSQIAILGLVFEKLAVGTIASWPRDEKTAYHNLKFVLERFLNGEWFKTARWP